MQKITPFLWFDKEAEDAARFYVSVFPHSKITGISHYGPEGPGPEGSVMTVSFELDGVPFTALNGGPVFKFNESVSFQVACDTQAEVDHYWDRLSEGGQTNVCGWTKDKYGLSWQVTPVMLMELIAQPDREKANRVMSAMMQMTKIDIAKLEQAALQPA